MTIYEDVTLFRKDNKGKIDKWRGYIIDPFTGERTLIVEHGKLEGHTITETINTHRKLSDELKSRINAKRKSGYKTLDEVKDNVQTPVKGSIADYLRSYLPDNRTNADGELLPMLAKVYDNTNNKLFNKNSLYLGQWKINGLRCFISGYTSNDGLFNHTGLKFMSREGTVWKSLGNLEQYLMTVINHELLDLMINEGWVLDGELYLPGYSVNEINHFVKDPNCPQNKLIQFWCYDIAIPDTKFETRNELLLKYGYDFRLLDVVDKESHMNVTNRFNILPSVGVYGGSDATTIRDHYISMGFEGLILRDINAVYQYGKRNLSMIKYKKSTDGKFKIVDIKPEGIKRPDIPLFVCKNDINDSEFEVHISDTLDNQRMYLKNKEQYIGKFLFVEYGERSGISQVPFHVKEVRLCQI